jgi:hypothetical protein
MWLISRRHHNLPADRDQRLITNDKRRLTLMHNENLCVRVGVKVRPSAR